MSAVLRAGALTPCDLDLADAMRPDDAIHLRQRTYLNPVGGKAKLVGDAGKPGELADSG
jgi:hypothetical protein